MIELTTRMLEQINRRDFPPPEEPNRLERLARLEELGKNSEYRKVRTVYELGYKLLESVAAGNDLMKVKISKYLKHYLSHILEKANRTVYRSIQEFLDGNYLALGEIEDDYIKDLISHLDKADPDAADLYFLSRLCLCREKTVTKNQVGVFSNFYSLPRKATSASSARRATKISMLASSGSGRTSRRCRFSVASSPRSNLSTGHCRNCTRSAI